MIFKSAIKEYLNRDLNDWSFVKNIPRDVLEKELFLAVPELTFKTEPRISQLACCYIALFNDCFNLWMTMGTGKSKAVLDMIRIKQLLNKDIKRILVVCLGEVSAVNWQDQINEHTDYSSIGLFGDRQTRYYLLEKKSDIYMINYEGLLSLLSVEGTGKKRSKTKNVPDDKAIKYFASLFDCIIMDETPIKTSSHQSLTFRILKKMIALIPYRYSLTGTPFGKDPMKLWAPYYLVDRGETLGTTLGLFQQAFFNSKPGYFGGMEYQFDNKLENILHTMLKHKSIRYTLSELADIPPVTRIIRKVAWPAENLVYYERAMNGLQEELRNNKDFKSIENSYIKLRQIASGFLGFKNDEEERVQIKFDENPRLDMLQELLLEIPKSEKVIIFNEFIVSGDLIEERLKLLKEKYVRLYGNTKDKPGAFKQFLDKDSCRIFLVQSRSGGIGLNLQIAKYGIFYESSSDCIVREQCEARYTGARQTHPHAFMYDIVMINSVDLDILQSHKDGKSIFTKIIDRRFNDKL